MLEFKNLIIGSRFPVQSDCWTCIWQCKINRTCSISLALWPWAAFNLKCVNVKWSNNTAPELCEASSAVLFLPAGPPASPASSSFSLDKAVAGSTRDTFCTVLHPKIPHCYFTNLPARYCAIIFIITREWLLWRIARGLFGGKKKTKHSHFHPHESTAHESTAQFWSQIFSESLHSVVMQMHYCGKRVVNNM